MCRWACTGRVRPGVYALRMGRAATPKCHSCHRRALRWLDRRERWMCDSCGKVFDHAVVVRHNPDAPSQMHLRLG
jgi:ribosomal protein L37AE/L43A